MNVKKGDKMTAKPKSDSTINIGTSASKKDYFDSD